MKDMHLLAAVLSCAALLGAGCDGGVDQNAAAAVILEHLEARAPRGPDDLGWDQVRIQITRIEPRDGGDVAVGFHAVRSVGGELPPDSARGPEYSALLRTTPDGLAVARYGPLLEQSVGLLIASELQDRHAELYQTLDELYRAGYAGWRPWMSARKNGFLQPLSPQEHAALVRVIENGPPTDTVYAAIREAGVQVPPGVEWGLTPSTDRRASMVLWVRADQEDVVCARRFAAPGDDEFAWLAGKAPTCRGGGAEFIPGPDVQVIRVVQVPTPK